MSETNASDIFKLWNAEISDWIAPIVNKTGWSREDRQELTADIRARILRRLKGRVREVEHLKAYSTTVARHCVFSRQKRMDKEREHTQDAGTNIEDEPDPRTKPRPVEIAVKVKAGKLFRREVERLINQLNPAWCLLLELRIWRGMTGRAAARELQMSHSTAQYRVLVGLAHVRQGLITLASEDAEFRDVMNELFGEGSLAGHENQNVESDQDAQKHEEV